MQRLEQGGRRVFERVGSALGRRLERWTRLYSEEDITDVKAVLSGNITDRHRLQYQRFRTGQVERRTGINHQTIVYWAMVPIYDGSSLANDQSGEVHRAVAQERERLRRLPDEELDKEVVAHAKEKVRAYYIKEINLADYEPHPEK